MLRVLLTSILWIAAPNFLAAGDWPNDYVATENSKSPDGRYSVIVQSQDAASQSQTDGSDVYLADVKNHTTLGKIDKADYFVHQNHRGLEVFWALDSSYCVVENDARYGMDTASVLEIKDSKFVQTEIGEHIQKALDGAMKKQSHDGKMSGDVSLYVRLGTDRKIRARATSQNNPKQFEDVKTYYALFQGTYDVAAKKWTVMDARSITADQSGALETAYQIPAFEDVTYSDDESRAESLDEQMNSVYQAAKFILPSVRFAKVKQEQTDWLKKRDAASSITTRCEMMEKRIKELRDVLW